MMRKLNLFIIVTALVLASCKQTTKENFTPLFNGENFEGWYLKLRNGDANLAKKVFAIENNEVHVFNETFPDTIALNGDNATHGLFYTDKVYSKFILKFEYKWGSRIANNFNRWQYDAGCYYHVVDDKIWPVGLEYQIRYDHTKNQNHTGDFWASKELTWYSESNGSTFLSPANGGKEIKGKKGEILGTPTDNHNALNDKWNVCEVIVMGDAYVIHKLNGTIVNMATKLPFSEGKIGFQSETAEIFYRNILIQEFDDLIPMEQFMTKK